MMTIFTGQHIGVANIAPIPSLVMLSLRFTLLSSFWALDWTIIVIVVSATQTGSLVDGFATEMTSKQLDRGNPLHDYTSTHYPWHLHSSALHQQFFPQNG